MFDISLPIAFLAGLISFASPCVLPIIPGFLAYIAGASLGQNAKKRDIFLSSVFFVLGFSIVFALLGVLLNTVLVHVAYEAQTWLARIGGVIIIVFGLYLTGLLGIPWLGRAHTMRVKTGASAGGRSRHVTSFLFGFAFAAGWTPCVGAILGAIIALAAAHPGSAFFLLLAYSIGLGVPFLVVGLFASQAARFIEKHARIFAIMSKIFGGILVILGIFVFTQELSRVANFDFVNRLLLK